MEGIAPGYSYPFFFLCVSPDYCLFFWETLEEEFEFYGSRFVTAWRPLELGCCVLRAVAVWEREVSLPTLSRDVISCVFIRRGKYLAAGGTCPGAATPIQVIGSDLSAQ